MFCWVIYQKKIMNLEKKGKVVNKMFNYAISFCVTVSDIHDTICSAPGHSFVLD